MRRARSLSNRLQELFLSGKWIANTNYKELISSVTWKQATQQIGSLNTIAKLAFHIDYYLAGLIQVLEGGPLEIRDQFSFDMPAIDSEEAWMELVNRLIANAEKFVSCVDQMTDEALDAPFVDEKYGTTLRNIEGVIEHGYYHLGQIALIKKLTLK